jgi:hypothetical protein
MKPVSARNPDGCITIKSLNDESEPLESYPSYKDIRIVPLETNDSCLIGFSSKFLIKDSLVFMSDFQANLYVFDLSGRFLNRIGRQGEGPEEYVALTTFFVDDPNDRVVIVDVMKRAFLYYDYKGIYKSKKDVPEDEIKALTNVCLLDDGHILLNYCINPWENTAYNLLNMKNMKSIGKKTYSPITISGFMLEFSKHPITESENGVNFVMPLSPVVFNCHNGVMAPVYRIEHSQKMAPIEKYRLTFDNSLLDVDLLYGRDSYFTGFKEIFETKNHILLNYRCAGAMVGYYIANKKRQEGRYYVQSVDEYIDDFPFFSISETMCGDFVSVCESEYLLFFKDNIRNSKNNPHLEKLKSVLDHLKEDDNPVLIFYQFKDDY